MRISSTIVSGLLPPTAVAIEEAQAPHLLGTTVVLGALLWARTRAATEMDRAAKKTVDPGYPEEVRKNFKRATSGWYLVLRLAKSLLADGKPEPGKLQIARQLVGSFQHWSEIALWLSFAIRDEDTTRLVAGQQWPGIRSGPTPSLKKRRLKNRTRIRTLGAAYVAVRAATPNQAAEHQKNKPFGILHARAATAIAALTGGGCTPEKLGVQLRKELEKQGGAWSAVASSFEPLPRVQRLVLVAGWLLRLEAAHQISSHNVDFVAENLLSRSFDTLLLRHIQRHMLQRNNEAVVQFVSAFRDGLIQDAYHGVISALSMGRNFRWRSSDPERLHELVRHAMPDAVHMQPHLPPHAFSLTPILDYREQAIVSTSRALRTLTLTWRYRTGAAARVYLNNAEQRIRPDAAATIEASGPLRRLPTRLRAKAVRALQRANMAVATQVPDVGNVQAVEDFASAVAPRAIIHLVSIAAEKHVPSISLHNMLLTEQQLVVDTLRNELAHTTPANLDAEAAVLVKGWNAPHSQITSPSDVLTSTSALLEQWDSSAPFPTSDHRQLVIRARIPKGMTDLDTAQTAYVQADEVLTVAWFLGDQRFRVEPQSTVLLRHGSEIRTQQYSRGKNMFTGLNLDHGEMITLKNTIDKLSKSSSDLDRHGVWARLVRSIGFYKQSLEAQNSHDRFLSLWLALEGLLANLDSDLDAQIGDLVSYRAALLLAPSPKFAGLPYGVYRWALAMELETLYVVRCKVVHEARRKVALDDVVLDRLEGHVNTVLYTVLLNHLRYGSERIDNLLAWREYNRPPTDIIQNP